MRSIHTIRWVGQLKDSGHDVHWFDILNGGYIKEWDWVTQHTNWRYKLGNFKGRYLIKKYFPYIHILFKNSVEKKFNALINEIQPDVVHSLVMYNCTVPIYNVMKQNSHIKWIYSAWGNDLFFYKNVKGYREDILEVLPQLDFMFADCHRDIKIAKELGFRGETLGVFPTGGGYKFVHYDPSVIPLPERNIILIKGYEQRFGKAIQVILALKNIEDKLKDFRVIVFGADDQFHKAYAKIKDVDFIEVKGQMPHVEVITLMGQSLIYVGNSISDGMPNTLLEAIIMGAFPIQSNPGGASAEIIKDNVNGLLINKPESVKEIEEKVIVAISNRMLVNEAYLYNRKLRNALKYETIQYKVLRAYCSVKNGSHKNNLNI
ncbi:glycosyltransferase [Bizionia argentinensis]|nr:glycosyltransferase [Bizionia argentinensis]